MFCLYQYRSQHESADHPYYVRVHTMNTDTITEENPLITEAVRGEQTDTEQQQETPLYDSITENVSQFQPQPSSNDNGNGDVDGVVQHMQCSLLAPLHGFQCFDEEFQSQQNIESHEVVLEENIAYAGLHACKGQRHPIDKSI